MQQARAEQEEEFISNTLFKKIQALQKEKETLAVNYEKEEEFLTNELSRKLMQVCGFYTVFSGKEMAGWSWKEGGWRVQLVSLTLLPCEVLKAEKGSILHIQGGDKG